MNGIIYCRVSSKEQVEGTSLESQELACREYARSKNIRILKVFVERGESAKFADRTQLLDLINFCRERKGAVQLLLVWKIDRFARNVGDHFNIKATLMKYGLRIVSVTEPIDSNPEGKLMETILAGFAQFDNDIRAMRTVQGMRRKLQEGIFPWKPPLGYKSANSNGEKKNEPDRPDQPLFGLLQKAWKVFSTGAYTKAEMRRLTESWGIQTQKEKPISNQSLDNLFRNKYYAGILVDPWSGEEYEGKHLPMVSCEEFASIQQIITKRNRSIPHQKERPEFPLRGVVRCRTCREYMTGSFSRGRSRRYAYYRCNHPRCRDRKSYAAELIHSEFRTFLSGIAPKPELIGKLGELVVQTAEERLAFSKTKHMRRKGQLERLESQMRELISMRAERLITDQEFLSQKALLAERRFALEGAPASDSVDVTEIRKHLNEIIRPLSCLPETWQSLPTAIQRRFQRLILPVGFVHGESGTAELGLLFRALGDLDGGKTTAVALGGKSWNRILTEIKAFSELFAAHQASEMVPQTPVPKYSRE
jgi:DNA invertase Pin-like site-specific DNA recombinase